MPAEVRRTWILGAGLLLVAACRIETDPGEAAPLPVPAASDTLFAECPERPTITYDAEAGEGFSGGPVVDAASGAVVGITVGYLDGAAEDGGRRMYAMGMDFVMAEMRRLVPSEIAAPGR